MIQWNPVIVNPVLNPNDEWDKEHGFSDRSVVRVTYGDGEFVGYSIGKYNYTNDRWYIEGYYADFKVSHWSSLNEPES